MARGRRGMELERFEQVGFTGMRDQRSQRFAPSEMLYIQDLFPESLDRPSILQLRPGFKRWSASGNALIVGAAAAVRKVVWSGYCRFASKNVLVIINTDGVFSLAGFGSYTITTELTNAQVTGAGANLASVTGAVFFRQKLIVTTSAGKPWTWDGTTGGGVSVIANAASGYDLPTVYVAKVFFRKGSGSSLSRTIVWSEENDETIGYETAPYANVWELSQTSQEPINDLVATEGQLVVLRPGSIGSIEGEVDANFKTTATRQSISDVVGSIAGAGAQQFRGFVSVGGSVLFFDSQNRPTIYRPGRGLVPLWTQLPRVFNKQGPPAFDDVAWSWVSIMGAGELLSDGAVALVGIGCHYDPQRRCNVFVLYGQGGPNIAYLFYFNAENDRLVAIWRTSLASSNLCIFSTGQPFTSFNTVLTLKIQNDSSLYFLDEDNQKTGSQWRDETVSGIGNAYFGMVISPPFAWDSRREYHWEQLVVTAAAISQKNLITGYLVSTFPKGQVAPASQGDLVLSVTNAPYEERVPFAIDGIGRWLMAAFAVTTTGTTADSDRPEIHGIMALGRQLATPDIGAR